MNPISIKGHILIHGDCREVLQTLPENSVDAIVTDPPYGLEFMGKEWDGADGFRRSLNKADVGRENVFGRASRTSPEYRTGHLFQDWCEAWAREALRVLKPGGHMLAFGGSRTYHRLAAAIEDAGFEIRDQIMWLYGSGFPKSKNLDGAWQGWGTALKPAHEPICVARKPLVGTVAENALAHGTGALNIDACRVPHETVNGGNLADNPHLRGTKLRAAPVATGFGRVGDETQLTDIRGRWPANVIHDGSDEVLAAFPDAPGQMVDVGLNTVARKTQNAYGAMRRGNEASANSENLGDVGFRMRPGARRTDAGSAARFFYCAKASRADRNDGCEHMERRPLHWSSGDQSPGSFQGAGTDRAARNDHPTVKPTKLMRYLVRMITPPGGTALDLFAGSGSTGRACALEGFTSISIEQDAHYCDIAAARIRAAVDRAQDEAEQAEREQGAQGDLFAEETVPRGANFERGQNTFPAPAATMDTRTTEAGVL